MNIHDVEIKDGSQYLKLAEGDNVVRIVSDFVSRTVTFKDGKTALKYTCLVIDRKSQEVRLADFGTSIMKQLKTLATSADYKFDSLPPYDLTINKSGSGLDTSYTLTAARKDTELTAEEKAKIVKAGTLDEVLAKLDKSNEPEKQETPEM